MGFKTQGHENWYWDLLGYASHTSLDPPSESDTRLLFQIYNSVLQMSRNKKFKLYIRTKSRSQNIVKFSSWLSKYRSYLHTLGPKVGIAYITYIHGISAQTALVRIGLRNCTYVAIRSERSKIKQANLQQKITRRDCRGAYHFSILSQYHKGFYTIKPHLNLL